MLSFALHPHSGGPLKLLQALHLAKLVWPMGLVGRVATGEHLYKLSLLRSIVLVLALKSATVLDLGELFACIGAKVR